MASSSMTRAQFEETARKAFNESQGTKAEKRRVSIRRAKHEFDLYQEGVVAGGVSTAPWVNRTARRTNNSGGQDRVTAELLWLHLCDSAKRKVLILKERDMADKISHRFGECGFFSPPVEVWIFDPKANAITHHSNL